MADITISIPTPVVNRVLDAIAAEYGYNENQLPAETKGQFAKRMVVEWAKNVVRKQEGRTAQSVAYLAAIADVDTNVDIT